MHDTESRPNLSRFVGVKSKSSAERAKLRAARFILEDVDLNESEDLPKEVYVLRYEEENFVRLKTTKQEKRLQRSFLPGGLSDTSSRLRQMQILLQSVSLTHKLEYLYTLFNQHMRPTRLTMFSD
ncbi:unnamed protein product [Trichobilharzia regenti]|nr:unnamed protein product [Trichobilharzia regenti]